MPANRRRRTTTGTSISASLPGLVSAIGLRGERFEVVPAHGYQATGIILAEYRGWLGAFEDKTAQARIAYNVGKLARGLMGDWKEVGGVYEMRVDYVPGYRVYFAKYSDTLFIVALGGDKTSRRQLFRPQSGY
jgi:putative addiction module killer protein